MLLGALNICAGVRNKASDDPDDRQRLGSVESTGSSGLWKNPAAAVKSSPVVELAKNKPVDPVGNDQVVVGMDAAPGNQMHVPKAYEDY